MNPSFVTAKARGCAACRACSLVSHLPDGQEDGFCPRCGEPICIRRRHSRQTAAALVASAAICYVPANLLPVMRTYSLGGGVEEDTIIGGVMLLYGSGSWFLALVVLVASIMIPLGKLVALGYLLWHSSLHRNASAHEESRLYHVVEVIGRWSMLDVFVASYTVALVQLRPLISIVPGPGILFFAAVVILTMLAVEYLDPRLNWDVTAKGYEHHV